MRFFSICIITILFASCKADKKEDNGPDKKAAPVIDFVTANPFVIEDVSSNPSVELIVTCENELSSVQVIRVDGETENVVWRASAFSDLHSYTYNASFGANKNTTELKCIATDTFEQSTESSIEIQVSEDEPVGPIVPEPIGDADAFPGAEGFGRYTTGGRGGRVYYVTSLEDNNTEGTLRYAINQSGPRMVLFKVSGTIELKSRLQISNGDITIAGQTAPGDGICVKNYEFNIGADNVIIRFIRARLGDDKKEEADAMGGRYHSNIIIDHCSMSWSVDECVSFYSNTNTTVQWCLVAESLKNSVHTKEAHGYGGIWGGKNATFHHNLMAHHSSRTPRFGPGLETQGDELVDFRNNVIYNWSGNGCYGGEAMKINIVNNYYKPGPSTPTGSKRGRIYCADKKTGLSASDGFYPINEIWGQFYVDGNVIDASTSTGSSATACQNATNDNWTYGIYNQINSKYGITDEEKQALKADAALESGQIDTYSAEEAYTQVLQYVGCCLSRDELDARVILETQNGTATYTGSISGEAGIIDTPSDVGGYPVLNSTEAPVDTDRDGMPDEWEEAKGLNKNSADGVQKTLDDSYTNLEVYLNELVNDYMLQK